MNREDGNSMWDIEAIKKQAKHLILEFYNKHGRMINSREWDQLKMKPTRATIRKYLGLSFNDFIKSLGFTENNPTPRLYTKKGLIDFLLELHSDLGRTPTTDDFKNNSNYPSLSVFYHYFDSFPDALLEAGLTFHRGYSKEFLIVEK